ncbi:unnamed protein product [Sphenostylis stenocarpa]|uniref:Uncharacterized protein n=1 Tax=Sphenostylis stenocarpa TaxID=92480 RepID=A0AA86V1I5_9FABA|nr:unnamed protein product [Sphenostylis stenocarpa]
MWGTIANFKENLNKIALDVHYDHDEYDAISPAVSDRRNSHSFAHSNSLPSSPPPNGMSDHPYASELMNRGYFVFWIETGSRIAAKRCVQFRSGVTEPRCENIGHDSLLHVYVVVCLVLEDSRCTFEVQKMDPLVIKSIHWLSCQTGPKFAREGREQIEQYKAEIKRLQASEAEIKALSVNYAALLKEKEDHIVRLNKENGSLKQSLDTIPVSTNGAYTVMWKEMYVKNFFGRQGRDGETMGNSDQSSNRQHRFTTQMKNHFAANNGSTSSLESNAIESKMVSKHSNSQVEDKELADMVEGKSSLSAAVQHSHEIQKMKLELEQEHKKLADIQLKFQEEDKLNKSFQEELKLLKLERDKTTNEISKLHNDLNGKISEINRLQTELNRWEDEEASDAVDSFRRLIETLEKENTTLKLEKDELEAALKSSRISGKMSPDASQIQKWDPSCNNHLPDPSESFPGKELERSLHKLSKELEETQKERDKAVQQLTRLKQHLLEKESEESEKMDEDSKIIEELRDSNNYLRAQISHLERSLKQATVSQEKLKMANDNEILRSKEIIDDLNKKLTDCMSTIDAKNTELLNLQTALGQYYAEIEAKVTFNFYLESNMQ